MKTAWLRRFRAKPTQRVAPQAEWLEPRLLYSADLAAALLPPPLTDDRQEVRTLAPDGEFAAFPTAAGPDAATAPASAAGAQSLAQAYATTALNFEQNVGQVGSGIDFLASGSGYNIALSGGNAGIYLSGAAAPVRLELVGGRAGVEATGEGLLAARSNYLLGSDQSKWLTGIANYGSVRYDGVYEGVAVRYYGNQRQLEYDFIVAAGADAGAIRLRFEGAAARLDADGNLLLRTPEGRELRFDAPVSYQEGSGGREAVTSAYRIHADGSIGFQLGAYDRGRALVIDPVLSYASYFGDGGTETGVDVAVDAAGAVYVTGTTDSTGGVLGGLVGGLFGGTGVDTYVAKFSADLSTLVWTSRVGGAGEDQARSIAVDSAGNVVVTGWSKSDDFPDDAAADGIRDGSQDAIVYKLKADGSGLVFSTYYGDGSAVESGNGVAVDAAGNVYVAGAASGTAGGNTDAFVAKYSATGAALFTVKYGGGNDDVGNDVAVDASGNIYMVGNSKGGGLSTPNGHQVARAGGDEGFLVRFNGTGALTYGTFIGGIHEDTAVAVAVDGSGRAYVVGQTAQSNTSGFALTTGAWNATGVATMPGYLRIYDTNASGAASLKYSTLVGNANGDRPLGVALRGDTVVVVTQATGSGFAVTGDAVKATHSAGTLHIAVLNPEGKGAGDLLWGSFYGQGVTGGGIAAAGSSFYIAGSTSTSGLATTGAYATTRGGGQDAIVARVSVVNDSPVLTDLNAQSMLEDATNNGFLVSALVDGKLSDTHPTALLGIAITGATAGGGAWEYSLNNGGSWTALGAPTAATALLLSADTQTRLRFVAPATHFNGTGGTLTVRGWDRTSGTAGGTGNASSGGAGSAFSSAELTTTYGVTAVNDQPVLFAGSVANVTAIEETLTSLGLGTLDYRPGGGSDEDGQTLSFSVTAVPLATLGQVLLADGTTVVVAGGNYSLADIRGMQFQPAAGRTAGSGTFSFTVSDGGGTSNGGVEQLSQALTITVANQPPVLDGVNPVTQLEDGWGTGTLVADLIDGRVTDPGGVHGIAVVGESSVDGEWFYTRNGGTTWSSFDFVSTTNARLLVADAQTRIVFVPHDPHWNGTATGLQVRAWDGSTGTAGGLASTLGGGVTSAFSGITRTVTTTVTPVNDAPVLTGGSLAGRTVVEGSTSSLGLGTLGYGPGGGGDEAAQVLTYTVTGVPTTIGAVQLSDGTAVVANATYTLAQLQGLRFVAAAGVTSGTEALAFTVSDSGGNANGGTNARTQTLNITVANQAPVLSGANPLPTLTEDPSSNDGMLVADLVDGKISDPSGAYGIAVTAAASANGSWEYSRDGGASWSAFTGVSNASATLLAADGQNRVRFVPNGNWSGTAGGLVYKAWDQSGGTAGATSGDTRSDGGTSPWSSATATASFTVTPVDDASTLATDDQAVDEDNTASGNVLGNDTDIDSTLAVASFTLGGDSTVHAAGASVLVAGKGTFTLAANGSYSFTPLANWNGSAPVVTYTTNTSSSSTLTITVDPVDDASVLGSDSKTVDEDNVASGNVLANDSDVETTLAVTSFQLAGDTTVYAAGDSVAVAGKGTFTLAANGSYSFTPLPHWSGSPPVVTYTTNTASSSTLAITVDAVDDPSVLGADTNNVDEDNAASGNVLTNDSDVESTLLVSTFRLGGDATVYTAGASVVLAGKGTFTLAANGNYSFTPLANWNGSAPVVTYTTNTSSSSTLEITIDPVDDASVLGADSNTVDEDTTASGNVLGNDTDIDSTLVVASFTLAGDSTVHSAGASVLVAGKGTFTLAADGSYSFTPLANWSGSAPVVTYITNTSSSSTLAITVDAVDDPSVLGADTKTVDEDNAASGNVLTNDSDVETTLAVTTFRLAGDTTVYTAGASVLIAGKGTFTLAANGNYTFTPLANWSGSAPVVTYTTNTSSSSTLAITVDPVDDASVMGADSKAVDEDSTASGNVLTNDSDVETTLAVTSFQLAGDATVHTAGASVLVAGKGTFTLAANGSYSFTPLANWNGSAPVVTYTTNTASSSTLSITVDPVDDASVLGSDGKAVDEDNVASGNVLANDSDAETTLAVTSFQLAGDTTVYTAGASVLVAGKGTFTLAADGSYSFTPLANWSGSAPVVTYTTNTSSSSTLAITVDAVDDPSVLGADTKTVDEDNAATGNVLTNDSDVETTLAVTTFRLAGDTTVYTAGATVLIAGKGTFTLAANGNYTFTPLANWSGSAPVVTYTTNTSSSSTLAITVDPVDDASVLGTDGHTVDEDTTASGNVLTNDSDVETTLAVTTFRLAGDATVYTAGASVLVAGKGTFTLAANGSYSFTPLANWSGSAPVVTYTTNTAASSTLTITVDPVDDPSLLGADSKTVDEDTTATGNVLTNDSDVETTLAVATFRLAGDTTVYTAGATVLIAGKGTFTLAANGNYTFTPLANWSGSAPVVTYTTNTSSSSTLSITLDPVDDASVLGTDGKTVDEDTAASGNVLANDSDVETTLAVTTFRLAGDATVYTAGASVLVAGKGTFTLAANGSYSFTPLANWSGSAPVVTYTTNTAASSTLTITVDPVDDPSVLAADSKTVDEDQTASGNVLANDSDVETTLAVTSFRLAGDTTVYTAGASVAIAGKGTFTLATNGSYSFTPLANWNGSAPVVTYTTNTSSSSTLAIMVDPVDDASLLGTDGKTVDEDTAASGNVLANDSDVETTLAVTTFRLAGDATVYTAGASVVIAGKGTFTLAANGNYTFTPLGNWNGSAPVVTYTTNTSSSSTLAITVDPVDDASVLGTDSKTVDEDQIASGNVLTNDSDVETTLAVTTFQVAGDTTVYTAGASVLVAGKGTFTLAANGSYSFTPLANWSGSAPVVTYTTNTGSTSTLAVTVDAVDDPSVLVGDSRTVNEDYAASGNVLLNDSDVETTLAVASFRLGGDSTVHTAGASVVIAGKGTFTLAANGSYTFTPLSNWNGNAPVVTYTTNTGSSSTLGITIRAVDDASVLGTDTATVDEDTTASGNVLANDSDVETALAVATFQLAGDTTIYNAGASVLVAGKGTFNLAADGSYSFTPVGNWNGSAPLVTYTTNTSSSSTLSITVDPVDDASVLGADSETSDEDTTASGNVLRNDSDVETTLAIASFRLAGDATVHAAGASIVIAGKGTFTLAADGSYTFTPLANWNGNAPLVTYTTNTGSTSTLAITIQAADDASVLGTDTATVDEDTTASGNVLLNDSDVETTLAVATFQFAGDTTIYNAGASVLVAGKGTFTLAADGSYSFTPLADWNGSAPVVSYTTNTGSTSTLAITVDAVDDASVLVGDGRTVNEDYAASGNVLGNDSDVETTLAVASFRLAGDTTVYTAGASVLIAGKGTFTLAADGSYTFTPLANWNGNAPIVSYTTNTGATSTLAITIRPVDDASVLGTDTATVNEDSTASGNVLGNDSDVETTLSVTSFQLAGSNTVHAAGSSVTIAGQGTFTLAADGSYSFSPVANWNGGAPLVTYTTTTGSASTLAIGVLPVDDATTVAADGHEGSEDVAASGNVLANDSDVDSTLAVASFRLAGSSTVHAAGTRVTIAGQGTFVLAADGSYSFSPLANWNGSVPLVTYTTSTGASSTLAITLAVVDDPSVVVDDSQALAEDNAAHGNVLDNDRDADAPLAVTSFRLAGDATVHTAGATVSIAGQGSLTLLADGSYSFRPLANWNGSVPVLTYTTSTGATGTLALAVLAVDDASVVGDDGQLVDEDTVASGNVLANDSDIDSPLAVASFRIAGDPATWAAGATVTIAGQGSFTLAADGSWSFTPAADWNGRAPLVSYTTGTGATGTLSIGVRSVDDGSVLGADTVTVREDTVASGNVLANDRDVDSPLAVASFRVAGSTATWAAGQVVTLAGQGTFTLAADGSWSFTPAADWNGSLPLVSYTTDTGVTASLAVTVAAVNDQPVGRDPGELAVVEGSTTALGLGNYSAGGGADERSQAMTVVVSVVPPASLGRVELADGTLVTAGGSYTLAQLQGMRFVAAAGVAEGNASFRFTLRDSGGTLGGGVDRVDAGLELAIRNQAPVLAGANPLPTLLEDATANNGMSVADLVAGRISDPSQHYGIAVVAAASNHGQWQYSRDGGASWATLAGASSDSARLLAADGQNRVRFVAAADWNGVASGLAFRAWDGSGGTARAGTADARVQGGSSAFSSELVNASVIVQPVNDAPVPLAPLPSGVEVGGDGVIGLGLDLADYRPGNGSDEASQRLVVTITTLPPAGLGALVLADGTAVLAGGSYSVADLRGLRFVPLAGGEGGSAQVGWSVHDDGGTDSGGADRTTGLLELRVMGGSGVAPDVTPVPAPAPPPVAAPAPAPAAPPTVAPPPVAAPDRGPGSGSGGSGGGGTVRNPQIAATGDALVDSPPATTLLPQRDADMSFAVERRALPLESVRPAIGAMAERGTAQMMGFGPTADFQVMGFSELDRTGSRLTIEQFQQTLRSDAFLQQLDRLRDGLRQEFDLDRTVSISVAGVSLGLSVVYVLWLVRGGVLIGSYLSALPAWRLLDPLPVLAHAGGHDEDEEDEPLEGGNEAATADPLRGFA